MRLYKLGSGKEPLFDHEGRRVDYAELYVGDAGAVYALTDEQRDERDPEWRQGDPVYARHVGDGPYRPTGVPHAVARDGIATPLPQ